MFIPVNTLKQMVSYTLSGIVYVFLLLVLVVAGHHTVPMFPNQDLTPFYLSKLSGTGL